MNKSKKKGISAIEVITTVSIVVLITVVVLPQFSKIKERQSLNNSASTVITALNKASSQSLASVDSYVYGVRFNANSIVVFRGTTYSASTLNETLDIPSPSSITDVTLNGVSAIPGEMYFNRLTNIPSKTGTVTITTGSSQKIITIGATGIVSVSGASGSSNYNLNVTVSSGGSVSSSPGTINCNPTCSNSLSSGTGVILTATPSGGYTFSGWSGDCTGTGTCSLSMNSNKSTTATFVPSVTNYDLNVTVLSEGTVTSDIGSISCDPTCTESFSSGDIVTLTASPSKFHVFSEWEGSCKGQETNTCELTMDSTKNVTAIFAPE